MLPCSWWTVLCLFQVYNKVSQLHMYLFFLKFFSHLAYYRILSRAPWAMGFPAGSDGEESAFNVEDLGSIPGLGRSPRRGHGNPLEYSCLENSSNRVAWQATVHGVAKSWTRLNDSALSYIVRSLFIWFKFILVIKLKIAFNVWLGQFGVIFILF